MVGEGSRGAVKVTRWGDSHQGPPRPVRPLAARTARRARAGPSVGAVDSRRARAGPTTKSIDSAGPRQGPGRARHQTRRLALPSPELAGRPQETVDSEVDGCGGSPANARQGPHPHFIRVAEQSRWSASHFVLPQPLSWRARAVKSPTELPTPISLGPSVSKNSRKHKKIPGARTGWGGPC